MTQRLEPTAPEPSTAYHEWLAARPESVKELAAEYPMGTVVAFDGRELYVIGWTEDDHCIVSPIWVEDDADASFEAKDYVCAHCIRTSNGVSVRKLVIQ